MLNDDEDAALDKLVVEAVSALVISILGRR